MPVFLKDICFQVYYAIIAFKYHGLKKGLKKGFNVFLNKIKKK